MAGVLVLLLVAFVAVVAFIAWRSRDRPYVGARCCGAARWPPDDLSADDRST